VSDLLSLTPHPSIVIASANDPMFRFRLLSCQLPRELFSQQSFYKGEQKLVACEEKLLGTETEAQTSPNVSHHKLNAAQTHAHVTASGENEC